MARPRKQLKINFKEIDRALMRGELVRLRPLADRYGTCAPVIKRHLEERYGEGVAFVYGRSGGVRLTANAPEWWWDRWIRKRAGPQPDGVVE